jgi:predicted Fe-Mo cluster-binding NifX family protein
MTKVAIPIFQNRVSPVLDSCAHMLIVDIHGCTVIQRENVFLGDISLMERCRIIKNLGVGVVICGGVSETFAKMLKSFKPRLIHGISGDVEQVIAAFLKGNLDNPQFYMPGFKAKENRR